MRDFDIDGKRTVPGETEFYARVHPDDLAALKEEEADCVAGRRQFNLEYRMTMRNGDVRWFRDRGDIVRDRRGHATHMMGVLIDVTAEKERTFDLEHRSRHDMLTGLPNRDYLHEHLRAVVASATPAAHAIVVAFVDLNGFKAINDRFGHAAGDGTLVKVSAALKERFRRPDFVGRVGGDEFVVIAECAEHDVGPCVRRIRQALTDAFGDIRTAFGAENVGAAIGLVTYPGDARTADDLLRRADEAMYKAKATGQMLAFRAA